MTKKKRITDEVIIEEYTPDQIIEHSEVLVCLTLKLLPLAPQKAHLTVEEIIEQNLRVDSTSPILDNTKANQETSDDKNNN